MVTSFNIVITRALSALFCLTELSLVVNNVVNMPTKPMPSTLKLCGLFCASNTEAQ